MGTCPVFPVQIITFVVLVILRFQCNVFFEYGAPLNPIFYQKVMDNNTALMSE